MSPSYQLHLSAKVCILADPTRGGFNSRFIHVRVCVCVCVRPQLTKLFNIFGSGLDIFLKSFGDIPRISAMSVSMLVGLLSY